MRRKEKEITAVQELEEVISRNKVLRLGMSEEGFPYIVPLNYGYEQKGDQFVFYMHGAKKGRKMDILKKNTRVCIEIDCGHSLIEAENACSYSYKFECVIGFGEVRFLEDHIEKKRALNLIMKQQTGAESEFSFSEQALAQTCVYEIETVEITGKRKE